ncbi:MAG TPA: AAA family ATPase [Pseudonocardiaceae bacterium]
MNDETADASLSSCSPRGSSRIDHIAPCTLPNVKRVLFTGMSGTGKSAAIRELVARGYKAIDTDDGWCETRADGRQMWHEDAIQALLNTEDAEVLFVASCEENQAKFHTQFDHIILLSAPVETLAERLATRTNNSYGKAPEGFHRFLGDVETVEPLLRRVARHEVRTMVSLNEVVTTPGMRVKHLSRGIRTPCRRRPDLKVG